VRKNATRRFSTCGEAEKVREQFRNRKRWKYDVIPACIKAEAKPEANK
jgi:hypothetical protein